jgi:hypothetical protein
MIDTGKEADPRRVIRLRRDQVFRDLIAAMQVTVTETKPLNPYRSRLHIWAGTRSPPSDTATNYYALSNSPL